jgi:hypothetical protein
MQFLNQNSDALSNGIEIIPKLAQGVDYFTALLEKVGNFHQKLT